jgi:hypothetical protein
MFKIKLKKIILLYISLGIIVLAISGYYIVKYKQTKNIPANLILAVPFSTQAPNENWNRNEDCEETSITMVNAFLTGNTENILPIDIAQNSINKLKAWEQTNLGYNADTGVNATTRMAEGVFGLTITKIQDFTETDLKNALINNNPILLPINAKLLESQQYINDGPTYHMIIIRGFKDHSFIVNDPGTNNGNANEYTFDVLKRASADWNHTTNSLDLTRKFALVVSK